MSRFSAIEKYAETDLAPDGQDTEPIRMPPRLRWALVIASLAGFGYFAFQRDFVTGTFIGVAGLCALSGFRVGVSRLFSCLLGFAIAYRFAPSLGTNYEYQFSRVLETTGLTNRFLCIVVFGVVISAIVLFLSHKLVVRFMARRRKWAVADCYVGCIVGVGQAAFATLLLLGGILYLEPMIRGNDQAKEYGSTPAGVHGWVVNLAGNTRTSKVGPLVEQYNPFEYFGSLKQLGTTRKAVEILSNPTYLRRLVEHPSIAQLQEDPDVELALTNLRADPEIQTILQSGQPITRADALRLLSNPAVKDLVDQKRFMERAKTLILQQIEIMDQRRPAA